MGICGRGTATLFCFKVEQGPAQLPGAELVQECPFSWVPEAPRTVTRASGSAGARLSWVSAVGVQPPGA